MFDLSWCLWCDGRSYTVLMLLYDNTSVFYMSIYKHLQSLLYSGRWVSQCSFFTNTGDGIVKSRHGLGIFSWWERKSPHSLDIAPIWLRSYLTKPKQEIQVWDACREAEHSCRPLASCPPQSIGIPLSQSETTICHCDQVSPRGKYGW